jgi:hypothetical protein
MQYEQRIHDENKTCEPADHWSVKSYFTQVSQPHYMFFLKGDGSGWEWMGLDKSA